MKLKGSGLLFSVKVHLKGLKSDLNSKIMATSHFVELKFTVHPDMILTLIILAQKVGKILAKIGFYAHFGDNTAITTFLLGLFQCKKYLDVFFLD